MAPTVDQNKNKMSKQSCETERKKKYDRRRIYLGTASDEWERQRCRSGLSNALFATCCFVFELGLHETGVREVGLT